mmetsp:Transcript_30928/g.49700  ORF Transcript_30928/g.49700 Transcript_30928/m.49700 type:complete len:202 (+) Transcript_30928:2485-3090(+)
MGAATRRPRCHAGISLASMLASCFDVSFVTTGAGACTCTTGTGMGSSRVLMAGAAVAAAVGGGGTLALRLARTTRDVAAAPAVTNPPLMRDSEKACTGRGITREAPVMATPARTVFTLRSQSARFADSMAKAEGGGAGVRESSLDCARTTAARRLFLEPREFFPPPRRERVLAPKAVEAEEVSDAMRCEGAGASPHCFDAT